MAIFRKVASRIWFDPDFKRLSVADKLETIRAIVFNRPPDRFAEYAGPKFRQADGPKRRPDLYSAEWRALRLRVIAEQGTVCHHCGCECSADPTVDHLRPVASGVDPYDSSNLVVSCRSCNSRKGGREGWES